jgi:hypothetical protein
MYVVTMTKKEEALKRIRILAELMDNRFRIPGTSVRFGLDPILSIIPVGGSLITYIIGGYLVIEMIIAGASGKVVIKMILNVILDAIIGAIPFVGFIPDIFYRANIRNYRLLEEHYSEGKHQGSGLGILLLIATIILVISGAFIYGVVALFQSLF